VDPGTIAPKASGSFATLDSRKKNFLAIRSKQFPEALFATAQLWI